MSVLGFRVRGLPRKATTNSGSCKMRQEGGEYRHEEEDNAFLQCAIRIASFDQNPANPGNQ
jgi:hypothetical protein